MVVNRDDVRGLRKPESPLNENLFHLAMLPTLQHLRETHLIGPNCREWVLSHEHFPQLHNGRFVWVGHSVLHPPYRMVRLQSTHAHVVACFGGHGRTLINGRVVDWRPGQVLLAPRGACHAFEPAGRGPWRIAWIFCDDRKGGLLIDGPASRLIDADTSGFVSTLQLLTREAAGEAEPAAMQALITLLQTHTRRLTGDSRMDQRLVCLWERVEADLRHAWTCRDLAGVAAMSEEHLRRLCHRHYRRSPMHYVTQLRMQRAGILLRASTAKVETVAQQVGFTSPYAFSAAFKRWSGVPPVRFRTSDREARSKDLYAIKKHAAPLRHRAL